MQFSVRFSQTDQKLPVKFRTVSRGFDANFEKFQVVTEKAKPDYYEGEYVLTPTVDSQVFPTAEKTMKDDLTVKAIPTYCVGNTSGGSTFYIATMDEDPEGGVAVLGKAKLGSMIL